MASCFHEKEDLCEWRNSSKGAERVGSAGQRLGHLKDCSSGTVKRLTCCLDGLC